MIKAILFDKDGTLVEFNEIWIDATIELINHYSQYFASLNTIKKNDSHLNDTLNREKIFTEKKEELFKALGISPENTIIENSVLASGTTTDVSEVFAKSIGLDTNIVKKHVSAFYLAYNKTHKDDIKGIGDLQSLLKELKSKGLYLGVVTADNYDTTIFMLKHLGIDTMFDFIATGDRYEDKPHPDALHAFCDKFNLSPKEVLFAGDSAVDMEFGKHANAAVGVLSGAGTKEMLQSYTSHIIDSVMDILSVNVAWN